MKRILIAAAAFAALAGAAAAQPAYDPNQGGSPPSDYPPCTHPGQDRCVAGMHGHHHHHHGKDKAKTSSDGERG